MQPLGYRIVVEWSDDDKAYVARVPAFEACVAHGSTPDEATRHVTEAALAMVDILHEDGEAPPPEDVAADYSGQLRLRMPRDMHRALAEGAAINEVSLNTYLLMLLQPSAVQYGASSTPGLSAFQRSCRPRSSHISIARPSKQRGTRRGATKSSPP